MNNPLPGGNRDEYMSKLTEQELQAIRKEAEAKYPVIENPESDIQKQLNVVMETAQEAHIEAKVDAVTAERERAKPLVQMIEKTLQQYFEKYMPKKVNTSDEQQLGMYTAYWFLKDTLNQYNQ